MPRVRGLKTDATTRARLGPGLLAELEANLWAVDCQTCNRPLGRRKPALTVAANGEVAEASLHHTRCRRPSWESTAELPRLGVHQSWRSGGFAVRGTTVFLVNPACEVALLLASGSGWRLANLDTYFLAGLEPGWPQRSTSPVLTAALADGTLTVHFVFDGIRLASWSTSGVPAEAAAEIRGRGAVLVGVTTAADVTAGTTPELLDSLIARGQVALGWAAVDAEPVVLPATVAAVRGDGRLLAELSGEDRMLAVLQVATVFAGFSQRGGEVAHIVVPDEQVAARMAEMGRSAMDMFEVTLVRLSAPGAPARAAVVLGTARQFAARPPNRAELAIVMDVDLGDLPTGFADRYERVLTV